MNDEQWKRRVVELKQERLPLPGSGATTARYRRLMQTGREDLSLAKVMEAHWDALAILAEAGRSPAQDELYAVWASEIPGKALSLEPNNGGFILSGTKMFCSGAGLADRALITIGDAEKRMVEVDLKSNTSAVDIDTSGWKTSAFERTHTATVTFDRVQLTPDAVVAEANWYVDRPGFWHGACGPAACWAGGMLGLLDYAMKAKRDDPHTLAHLGAITANGWAVESFLETAGREIDEDPLNRSAAEVRALTVRHLIEQACTDTLRRFARAYGPHPMAMDAEVSRRYQELDLYLRQSHAERDMESLARAVKKYGGENP